MDKINYFSYLIYSEDIMTKKDTSFAEKMKALAQESELKFDGGGDDRLFTKNSLTVFVLPMSKEKYKEMEEQLKSFYIKGEGYTVYGWNDVSGYGYWKERAEDGEANYIQVSASIENIDLVDPKKLKRDVEKVESHFNQYENTEELSSFLSDKENYLKKIKNKK